ncbi:hypothetical protein FHS68_004810 [Dyadobacter arcticus]|uniref:ISXO2-like transposase domain-containing protein n=1 Tax=Dyadobacter arcticus TaxID=1078754 RepID=A0ABX0URM5_9BACT|nr:hypothetical protein [Dyadobacter arcticus]
MQHSVNYLQAYIIEYTHRFNRRKNGRDFGCMLGEAFWLAIDLWIYESAPGSNPS